MICPNCNQEATGNFCSNCGFPLRTPEKEKETAARQENSAFGNGLSEETKTPAAETAWGEETKLPAAESARGEEANRPTAESARGEEANRPAAETSRGESRARGASRRRDPEKRREERPERKEERADRREETAARRQEKAERKQEKADRRQEKAAFRAEKERQREETARKRREEREAREEDRRRAGRELDLEQRLQALEEQALKPLASDLPPEQEEDGPERETGRFASAVSEGVAGIVVLMARIMQLLCVVLMGSMVWVSIRAFWYGREGLGSITSLITERNYGLLFYLCFCALSLLMGVVWCFWIASGKAGGGGLRLKKYDTGRGFLPFLFCAAVVAAAGPVSVLIPGETGAWRGLAAGIFAALDAVNANHGFLLSASLMGAALSFVRKLLRV